MPLLLRALLLAEGINPGLEVRVKHYIALMMVLAGLATPAAAQQPASDEWQVLVAPYMMGAAMSGATTVRGFEVDVDVSASDIFSNLQFGAMASWWRARGAGDSAPT
jgi:hypothetical protein